MKKFNAETSILVVDDDAMVRSIVVEYLQEMGFQNVTAPARSKEALTMIQDSKVRVDLIISDWEMPGLTGLQLLKAVRNNLERKELPFIMMTSQRSMERIKISQAVQWAVSGYIMKPFRLEILRQKIYEVMSWDEKTA